MLSGVFVFVECESVVQTRSFARCEKRRALRWYMKGRYCRGRSDIDARLGEEGWRDYGSHSLGGLFVIRRAYRFERNTRRSGTLVRSMNY